MSIDIVCQKHSEHVLVTTLYKGFHGKWREKRIRDWQPVDTGVEGTQAFRGVLRRRMRESTAGAKGIPWTAEQRKAQCSETSTGVDVPAEQWDLRCPECPATLQLRDTTRVARFYTALDTAERLGVQMLPLAGFRALES